MISELISLNMIKVSAEKEGIQQVNDLIMSKILFN